MSPTPSLPKIPSEVRLLLAECIQSRTKNILTEALPSSSAISLRKQFYNWRTKILDHFVDPNYPLHFNTEACNNYLDEYAPGLDADSLQRVEVRMDPILSQKASLRRLFVSIRPKLVCREIAEDGSLQEIDYNNAPRATTRTHVADWGNGQTTTHEETVGGAGRAQRELEEQKYRELVEGVKISPGYVLPPTKPTEKPQWLLDLEAQQAKEKQNLAEK